MNHDEDALDGAKFHSTRLELEEARRRVAERDELLERARAALRALGLRGDEDEAAAGEARDRLADHWWRRGVLAVWDAAGLLEGDLPDGAPRDVALAVAAEVRAAGRRGLWDGVRESIEEEGTDLNACRMAEDDLLGALRHAPARSETRQCRCHVLARVRRIVEAEAGEDTVRAVSRAVRRARREARDEALRDALRVVLSGRVLASRGPGHPLLGTLVRARSRIGSRSWCAALQVTWRALAPADMQPPPRDAAELHRRLPDAANVSALRAAHAALHDGDPGGCDAWPHDWTALAEHALDLARAETQARFRVAAERGLDRARERLLGTRAALLRAGVPGADGMDEDALRQAADELGRLARVGEVAEREAVAGIEWHARYRVPGLAVLRHEDLARAVASVRGPGVVVETLRVLVAPPGSVPEGAALWDPATLSADEEYALRRDVGEALASGDAASVVGALRRAHVALTHVALTRGDAS